MGVLGTATASQPASPGDTRAAGFTLPLGFFPDAWGSTTQRFRGIFESQSFHHLSNSACPLVFSIKVAPLTPVTQWAIPGTLAQLPASGRGIPVNLHFFCALDKRPSVEKKKKFVASVRTISRNRMHCGEPGEIRISSSVRTSACVLIQSLHAIAELDQELIGGLKTDQTRARVLRVKDDVYDDDGHDREARDMKPTTLAA